MELIKIKCLSHVSHIHLTYVELIMLHLQTLLCIALLASISSSEGHEEITSSLHRKVQPLLTPLLRIRGDRHDPPPTPFGSGDPDRDPRAIITSKRVPVFVPTPPQPMHRISARQPRPDPQPLPPPPPQTVGTDPPPSTDPPPPSN